MSTSGEKLYTIGEVAKLTGVSIKTIRYYSDIDLLPVTHITEARFRRYSTEDIWRLQLIRVLRQLEFGLEEIRAVVSGTLSVSTAIDWQVQAIEQHIQQLQRVQAVLLRAQGVEQQPEQALRTLYELGIALGGNVAERSRFVTEKLHALVERAQLPEVWRRMLLEQFTWQSPDALTPQQIITWTEVVRLLDDPAFAEEALRFNTPELRRTADSTNIVEHNQQALTLLQRAQAAAVSGDDLASEVVQALLYDWIKLIATSMQRPVSSELLRELADQAATYYSERMQRFWTLMASISGREAPPDYKEGFELLATGLRLCASQIVK